MPIGIQNRLLRLAPLALLALTACGHVVETVAIRGEGPYTASACHSELGNYLLPKALLTVTATATASTGTTRADIEPNITVVADGAQSFCLDYLGSPTSIDRVTVARDPKGLLLSISSNVQDRTPNIVNKLIQTGENLALGAARDATKGEDVTDSLALTFDPFTWSDLMLVKGGLRRFGFCLYVEGYSFPTEGLSAAEIRAAASKWCSTPAHAVEPYEHPMQQFASLPVPPEVMGAGVLYRPKTAHKIVMLRKADPEGSGPWELYLTRRFDLPNVSPVLAIGIERAAFTTRKTTVNFNQGTLTDVAVDKDSEVAGFVTIPLTLAKAIVDVPGQIIKLRLADTQGQAQLVQAQGNLIGALANYNALVNGPAGGGAAAGLPKSAAFRDGQFVAGCVEGGGGPIVCNDLARSR